LSCCYYIIDTNSDTCKNKLRIVQFNSTSSTLEITKNQDSSIDERILFTNQGKGCVACLLLSLNGNYCQTFACCPCIGFLLHLVDDKLLVSDGQEK